MVRALLARAKHDGRGCDRKFGGNARLGAAEMTLTVLQRSRMKVGESAGFNCER